MDGLGLLISTVRTEDQIVQAEPCTNSTFDWPQHTISEEPNQVYALDYRHDGLKFATAGQDYKVIRGGHAKGIRRRGWERKEVGC
jgi:hypothetical protein